MADAPVQSSLSNDSGILALSFVWPHYLRTFKSDVAGKSLMDSHMLSSKLTANPKLLLHRNSAAASALLQVPRLQL